MSDDYAMRQAAKHLASRMICDAEFTMSEAKRWVAEFLVEDGEISSRIFAAMWLGPDVQHVRIGHGFTGDRLSLRLPERLVVIPAAADDPAQSRPVPIIKLKIVQLRSSIAWEIGNLAVETRKLTDSERGIIDAWIEQLAHKALSEAGRKATTYFREYAKL